MNNGVQDLGRKTELKLQIATLFFIAYVISLPQLLREAIMNVTSLGAYIRPLSLFCVVLPVAYLARVCVLRRGVIRTPYLGWVALLVAVQVFTEVVAYFNSGEAKLIMVQRHLLPYGVFLFLVNLQALSPQMFKKALDITISCLVAFLCTIYLGYVGILDLEANLLSGQISIFSSRPHDATYHPNYVSYLLVSLLAFILVRWKYCGSFQSKYEALIPVTVFAVVATITINATRAGILPGVVFGVVILQRMLKSRPRATGASLLLVAVVGIAGSFYWSSKSVDHEQTEELYLQQRFDENDDHRIKSSLRSLDNFYRNPFLGVGMLYAAGETKVGIVETTVSDARSNNQYTQNLGAGGLALFLVWLAAYYRLYFNPLFRRGCKVLAGFSLFLLYFHLFQRPAPWMGVYAFIVYIVSRNNLAVLQKN